MNKHNLDVSYHSIIAIAGKAVTAINGCTKYSCKEGLGLPANNQYKKLS